jgi:hypothetical protein
MEKRSSMEQIIQQITMHFVKEFMMHFETRGIYALGEMADDSLEMAKEFAKEILDTLITNADRSLVELKQERKSDGIAIHEREVSRTLHTALGDFTFERTYFSSPLGKVYLLDEILGINAYERVDTHVSAKMVNMSAEVSFGRSADIVTGGSVSRQTAWRKAMETGEVAIVPKTVKHTPERIHIFADEDHVHLQEKKSAILPIVTICEGKETVCKGRNELIDPIHINGYGLKPDRLWEYVYSVCAAKYDMNKVKEVYIYGDGAKWIDTSNICFSSAIRVLDGYHFKQRMMSLCAGEICSRYTNRLYSSIKVNRKDIFEQEVLELEDAIILELVDSKERKKKWTSVSENATYILSHWQEIQNIKHEGAIGSCTEAMVSHIFSERFSRNPMGWSRTGLSKMSMIRVFIKNGGKVMPIDIGADKLGADEQREIRTRVEKYDALVKKQQEEVLAGAKNWRWFERDEMIQVSPSGTKVALDALARMRKIS